MSYIGKITSKNQTTIPVEVRERLRIKAGDEVRYVVQDNGSIVIEKVESDISSLFGILELPEEARDEIRSKSWEELREEAMELLVKERLGDRD